MHPFIVIGHADNQEPVAKVIIADDESIAKNELTAFIKSEYDSDEIYIDGCDRAFNIVSERIKDDSLDSGALFLIVAHAEGDSLIWALAESSSLDCATDMFTANILKTLDIDIDIHIDIAVGLLDLCDNPIIASPAKRDQKVNRLEMLSIEVERDFFDEVKSKFDVFERPDLDNELIVDFSHLSEPENEAIQQEIATTLGLDASDIDGYICMYV